MGYSELLQFFMAGLALGSGACLAICLPIILPYISAGTLLAKTGAAGSGASGWKIGLRVSAVFSLARLFAYTLLGALAVLFYRFISALFSGAPAGYIQTITGILVIAAGAAGLLKPESNFICRAINRFSFRKMEINAAALGFFIGLAPCWPLYGALGYLAAMAPNFLWGIAGGFAFGLGTIISPLIPLGILSGHFSEKTMLARNSRTFFVLRIVSAGILLLFGLRLILTP